jgi:hypothetical protein
MARSDSLTPASLARVARGLCALLGLTGLAGLALSVSARASTPFAAGEAAASVIVLASAVVLYQSSRGRELPVAGLLPGELALDGAFLYLAMTAETFHGQHAVSRGVGVVQFAIVILELVAGCGALVFFRTDRRDPRSAFAMAVRSGVMLAVGSLLVAMAVAAASASIFQLPRWNWLSFLGLTVPGILLLIAREELKTRWRHARHPVLASLGTEGLLVMGLSVMLWGSTANLTLGVDAFRVGIRGDVVGVGLWALAAVALLARRVLWPRGSPTARRPEIAAAIAYSVALTVFVIGERAVELGRSPAFAIGHPGVAGALAVAAAGIVVLAVIRPVTFALDRALLKGEP